MGGTSAFRQRLKNVELQHKSRCEWKQRSDQKRRPERPGCLGNKQPKIGAPREERAMRQIEDIHQSENQRKAHGKQKDQHAELKTIQKLKKKELHTVSRRSIDKLAPWPWNPPRKSKWIRRIWRSPTGLLRLPIHQQISPVPSPLPPSLSPLLRP